MSVDMEGVAGVVALDQIVRGGSGYPGAQALMTKEANAAIRGAFGAGADEVIVNDSHGTMDNLLLDRIDSRARLVLGAPRPSCMVQGVSRGDALTVFVGYHAAAGTSGVLAHTFSTNFIELRVNARPMSEAQINGLYAASLGIPVGVVTGDDQICSVARADFPGVATVEVKRSLGFAAADSLSPHVACERIENATAQAVARSADLVAPRVPTQLHLSVEFSTPLGADLAATEPGSKRLSGRSLARDVDDVDELIRLVMAWYYLSSLGATTAGSRVEPTLM